MKRIPHTIINALFDINNLHRLNMFNILLWILQCEYVQITSMLHLENGVCSKKCWDSLQKNC